MKRDMARVYTDRKLHELTKELERVYARALDEQQAKWSRFMARHESQANKLWEAIKAAQQTGNAEAIEAAKAAYKEYLLKTVRGDKLYKRTIDEMSEAMAKIDRHAYQIANGYLPDVYAKNYNSLNLPKGYVLKVVNPHTVANLYAKEIDILKYTVWDKKRLNATILRGILGGDSIPKIAKNLAPMVDGNRAAAVRAARTAITAAENGGRMDSMLAAEELGLIYKKEWVATHDDRTRESHADIDGEQVFLDESFSNGCDYPGDPKGDPAEVYNCFVADTNIATDSNIIRSYKHKYHGELYSVKTAAGVCFTCTPNHPILTPNGWIAVNRLNEGDDLIIASRCNDQVSGWNPHINHRHSRIDTIHQFFNELGGKRTCALGVDFHGDIAASDVEIIRAKRLLGFNLNTCRSKRINKILFKNTDAADFTNGTAVKRVGTVCNTSSCILCGLGKAFALLRRCLFHSDKHSFGSVANSDAVFSQNAINDGSAESILCGKGFGGNAVAVLADKIISIDVVFSHCFVYNLQTKNGYYYVNSIPQDNGDSKQYFAIAHNCRCTMNRVLWGIEQADGSVKRVTI